MKKLILFAVVMAFLFSGCSKNGTGNFQIYLKDQPLDIESADKIEVTISEISVQKAEEGFLNVWSGEKTYDLRELMIQDEMILDITLEEGKYTQIRLVVTEGKIYFSGEPLDMTVASTEVKIPLNFDILDGSTTQITLDFEAENSIHVVSAGGSGQYILRPVVRVENISYE